MSSNLKEQIKDQIDGQNEQNNELIIESQKKAKNLWRFLIKYLVKMNLLI